MTIKEVNDKTKNMVSQAIGYYISDRPLWAKIVGISGTVLSLIGASLMTANPITAPASVASFITLLTPYSWYMAAGGGLLNLIAQGFSKPKEKINVNK